MMDVREPIDEGPETLVEALAGLHGRGVYDIALLEEVFARFGFGYDRATDRLTFLGRTTTVGACDAAEVRRRMDASTGGMLFASEPAELLVDAVAISEAVFALLFPGRAPWSRRTRDRDRALALNLLAIESGEGASTSIH